MSDRKNSLIFTLCEVIPCNCNLVLAVSMGNVTASATQLAIPPKKNGLRSVELNSLYVWEGAPFAEVDIAAAGLRGQECWRGRLQEASKPFVSGLFSRNYVDCLDMLIWWWFGVVSTEMSPFLISRKNFQARPKPRPQG